MKEITRIITAQMTVIKKFADEDADAVIRSQKTVEENIKEYLQKFYNADDVVVNIQDFPRDIN